MLSQSPNSFDVAKNIQERVKKLTSNQREHLVKLAKRGWEPGVVIQWIPGARFFGFIGTSTTERVWFSSRAYRQLHQTAPERYDTRSPILARTPREGQLVLIKKAIGTQGPFASEWVFVDEIKGLTQPKPSINSTPLAKAYLPPPMVSPPVQQPFYRGHTSDTEPSSARPPICFRVVRSRAPGELVTHKDAIQTLWHGRSRKDLDRVLTKLRECRRIKLSPTVWIEELGKNGWSRFGAGGEPTA